MSIVSQGRVISEQCSDCGATVVTEIVQRLIDGQLRWSASRSCTCGLQEEIECDEDVMTHMRQLLIEDAAFYLEIGIVPKAIIMATIRSVTTVSMQEASKQAADIANGSWRGTRPEATLLANTLAERGISSEVRGAI